MSEHGITIMKMLNEALGDLRDRGFAHRNLKPENILVSEDFKSLMLVDFHKCHHKDRFVKMQPGGTVPYWHAKNDHWAVASHHWDNMSFGVIGFEMMIPTDWWGKMKTSTNMQIIMKNSGRFHPFTKYQHFLFGMIAFGEIPDRVDQTYEIN
jgi:serine/threonine protein kinase